MNLVELDAAEHAGLRVRSSLPEIPHFAELVVAEFPAAAAVCPIFFAKHAETGKFYPAAMFGFRPGEDLVAKGNSRAPFVPLNQQRSGFYVSGDNLAVDLDDPRFSASGPEGEPLFEADGTPSGALRRAQLQLTQLVEGQRETEAFIAALLALKLVEPIDISLRFDDGEKLVLQGLYTVSLDALQELGDADVLQLFRKGYLQFIYAVAGSLKQVAVLAERRNRMLAGGE